MIVVVMEVDLRFKVGGRCNWGERTKSWIKLAIKMQDIALVMFSTMQILDNANTMAFWASWEKHKKFTSQHVFVLLHLEFWLLFKYIGHITIAITTCLLLCSIIGHGVELCFYLPSKQVVNLTNICHSNVSSRKYKLERVEPT
jgi:hypothetical protein